MIDFFAQRETLDTFIPPQYESAKAIIPYVCEAINISYFLVVILQFFIALGNKPNTVPRVYRFTFVYFSLVQTLTFIVAVGIIASGGSDFVHGRIVTIIDGHSVPSVALFAAGILLYFLSALLHGEFVLVCASFMQYCFMMPMVANVLAVYAFCNLQDLSWGTKGLEAGSGHGGVHPAASKKQRSKDYIQLKRAKEQAERLAAKDAKEARATKVVLVHDLILLVLMPA